MSSDSEIDVVGVEEEQNPTTSSRVKKAYSIEKKIEVIGNPRPPPIQTYMQWIVEAWNVVTKENIINSFKYCGLTNKTNGAEDDEIHCFKINGPVSEGRAQLRQARLDNELAKIFEEIDLEEDVENGNESDNSIEM
uniref:Uncharacterized protein n=2 Tax=Meloidogyne TaxID=189290 RepID=A0A6V7VWB8_MELEN|nr:unnamed protein product [Meloidogyne enterolobii]CAD2140475.1 unnamed protein product [Meloidogyne enterolobii]CAD2166879.1 unnamed protein product [Meloidogyne enterolobii]CAD2178924.1 unnamed protein product [Meloidogyne enterolobii]CAD2180845.1 unnamed protein product [Meloidogyne enterolobii]